MRTKKRGYRHKGRFDGAERGNGHAPLKELLFKTRLLRETVGSEALRREQESVRWQNESASGDTWVDAVPIKVPFMLTGAGINVTNITRGLSRNY